jgi:hypothetical protein
MREFRVYLLDRNNKIAGACWVEAADVQSAVVSVRDQFSCPCEIWDGSKRLAAVTPEQLKSGAARVL